MGESKVVYIPNETASLKGEVGKDNGASFSVDKTREKISAKQVVTLCTPRFNDTPCAKLSTLKAHGPVVRLGYKLQTVSKSARCLRTPVFIFDVLYIALFASKTSKD